MFQSRTNPEHWYTVDLQENPACDCFPATRRSASFLCTHLKCLSLYMKKLAAVMNATSSAPKQNQS